MNRFYEPLVAAATANRPLALAIIAGTKGSSPQRAGAKASRRKARIISDQFISQKPCTAGQFDRVVCPAGVQITAVSTHEIAMSILPRLVQKRAELYRPVQ